MLVLCVAMCACLSMAACSDNSRDKQPTMETDLSIDYDSSIGLYFYAADGSYVRYTGDISSAYFDRSKPTVVFFHGWMTESFEEGELCHNADSFVPRIIGAGYNFCVMDYCHYAQDIYMLFKYIWSGLEDSHSVACRFAREYAACFGGYDKDIRFVSHSYGAHSSVATTYLLSNMVKQGIVGKNCLPSRMTFADPYLGDIISLIPGYKMPTTIENIDEPIGERGMAELLADCLEYLANEGIVMDVYGGMPGAYNQYLEKYPERRDACKSKLYDSACWTILEGLQKKYGTVGDIHMLTLQWVFDSYFVEPKQAAEGYCPTASLDNEKMLALKGRCFKSTLRGLDVENDTLVEIDRSEA